jgi:hypothetical protein
LIIVDHNFVFAFVPDSDKCHFIVQLKTKIVGLYSIELKNDKPEIKEEVDKFDPIDIPDLKNSIHSVLTKEKKNN